MKTFHRRLSLFLCVCLLVAGTLLTAGQEIIRRPADEVYKDPETGLSFDSRNGNFVKMEVVRNENPVFGTTIRYQNENYSGADIYIYSLGTKGEAVTEEQFRQECAEVEKTILNMKKRNDIIESVSLLKCPAPASKQIFYRMFEIVIDGEKNRSSLMMVLYRGKIVKCRVTYPDDPKENAGASKEAREFENLQLKKLSTKESPLSLPAEP